ncbi:phosphoadenosine phosphosulfate reductase family protein [Pseudoalteromonas sp. ASV78]|uniref:phosphoadenosine phosphosulfate reductase domain-containing protein n=1 Tax=Pseudoalteromonas sp. ASV78 TaxID=3397851 RepID=UPI0039FC8AB8
MHEFDDVFILPSLEKMAGICSKSDKRSYFSAPEIAVDEYDYIILCMSGGKDSIAGLLHLIDIGADLNKIELWHHDVDGNEGSTLMDWPFMKDFNRKLADHFGLPIYFSWLEGGFEGEMIKKDSYSRPQHIETPNGKIILSRDTKRAKPRTRMKFPQVSANLQTRWCSSSLKIDIGRRAINNQDRFNNKKILFVTGERREESHNRAKYNQFEPHSCDRRFGQKARYVDSWRPVLHWDEEQVWEKLKSHGVTPPVPYRLGWSRSSCMKCIFNDPTIWATLRHHFQGSLDKIAEYENQFGITISRSRKGVMHLSEMAKPLDIEDREAFLQALKKDFTLPITQPVIDWKLPAGAFNKSSCGPS